MVRGTRRLLIGGGLAAIVLLMLSAALFLAYLQVRWPFTPKFVIRTSPWTEPQLRALAKQDQILVIHDERPWLQPAIAEDMAARGDEALNALLTCLRSDDAALRMSTLQITGDLPARLLEQPRFQQQVAALATDADRSVRHWALSAACDLPGAAGLPILKAHRQAIFAPGSDPDLRTKALKRMGIPGDPALVSLVQSLLGDASLRAQAISALAEMKDPSSLPLVMRHAADEDVEVRWAVEAFLEKMAPVQDRSRE
jgi:HEAT repeat protein